MNKILIFLIPVILFACSSNDNSERKQIDKIMSKGKKITYFPPMKKYKNISSIILLDEIKKIIKLDNSIISNLDCTIICQKIRLEKYKKFIRKNISLLM